jgi:hypothetical protein
MDTQKTKIPAHLYYKKIDDSVFPEKVTYYSVLDHRELSIEDILGSQKKEAEEK